MKLGNARPGFTLAELVFSAMISGAIFMALLAVQKSVLLAQQKDWRANKIAGDALYALEAIKHSLRRCSVIVEPEIEGASDRLFGYTNVNPDDNSKLTWGSPQEYFLYCFDYSSGTLYKYTSAYPPAQVFFPFYCGKPPEGSQSREILAGGLSNARVTYMFLRDPSNSNVISINYSFSYNGEKVNGDTSISIQKSL